MRYYCIGKGVQIRHESHPRMWKNLPITAQKAKQAFNSSVNLILCKQLSQILTFREVNVLLISGENKNYTPAHDYAIYEIEVSDKFPLEFKNLAKMSFSEVESLIQDPWSNVLLANSLHHDLPDMELCCVNQTALNPILINWHYFPLKSGDKSMVKSLCLVL